jgi:hypothetical protein
MDADSAVMPPLSGAASGTQKLIRCTQAGKKALSGVLAEEPD